MQSLMRWFSSCLNINKFVIVCNFTLLKVSSLCFSTNVRHHWCCHCMVLCVLVLCVLVLCGWNWTRWGAHFCFFFTYVWQHWCWLDSLPIHSCRFHFINANGGLAFHIQLYANCSPSNDHVFPSNLRRFKPSHNNVYPGQLVPRAA